MRLANVNILEMHLLEKIIISLQTRELTILGLTVSALVLSKNAI